MFNQSLGFAMHPLGTELQEKKQTKSTTALRDLSAVVGEKRDNFFKTISKIYN